MRRRSMMWLLILGLAACGLDRSVPPEAPEGMASLARFVGAPADRATSRLTRLGFQPVRQATPATYWLDPADGVCARIVTSAELVISVSVVDPVECGVAAS